MCLPHATFDFERKKNGYVAPPLLDETGAVRKGKGAPTLEADVQYIDHLVGRIVQHQEKEGLREQTVILFTGDNGTAGYGKGRVEVERGRRVPLIVNGPGLIKPIGASDELVDFSDVLPTVAGLAGISLPKDYVIDGHSFAPLLAGQPYTGREWIFSYLGNKRMLRDKRWLLDGKGQLFDCGD